MEWKSKLSKMKEYYIKFWGLVFFVGVSINFIEIICRTVFNFSWDLMYDLPVWITIWSVMMLAGPILPDGDHVSVDMLRDVFYGPVRKFFELINMLACIVFGLIISYGGITVVSQYYDFQMNIIRIISVPRWMVEICIPIGMVMFTLFSVYQFFVVFRTKYEKIEKDTDQYTS